MLAKALAHYIEAKLLLLDVPDFSLKVSRYNHSSLCFYTFMILKLSLGIWLQIQSKYGSSNKDSVRILILHKQLLVK